MAFKRKNIVRSMYFTLAIAVAIGVGASAQTDGKDNSKVQSMTGVVKAVSASSLAIETGGNAVVFVVDSSTRVLASKTQPRDLVLRKPERGLTDFVKTGDRVTVRYRPSGGVLKAVEVRIAPK